MLLLLMIIPIMIVITSECNAALFATSSLLAPIALTIIELVPTSTPFEIPVTISINGVTNPIAAKASDPSPDIHIISTRL